MKKNREEKETTSLNWLFYSNRQKQVLKKVSNADIRGVKNYFQNLTEFRRAQSELGQATGVLSQLEKNMMSTKKIENLKELLAL